MEDEYIPPPHPPPLLNGDQLSLLSQQGWLHVELPQTLHSDLQLVSADAASFFEADAEVKEALYPSTRGTECGYYVVPEEKEYVTFRHQLNPGSNLEQHVRSAWRRAAHLLHRVLCDLSKFHWYDPGIWDSLMEGTFDLCEDAKGMTDNTTLMRLFRYFAGGVAEPHVDVGLLTLCVGDGEGLQVLDRYQTTQRWVPAQGPIILVGEMASVLFSRRVLPGKHRVVGNPQGRNSTVFTLRPYLKGDLNLNLFGGEGTISTREFYTKSRGTKYNINATKDLREKQRQEQEERKRQRQLSKLPDVPLTQEPTSLDRSGKRQHEASMLRFRFSSLLNWTGRCKLWSQGSKQQLSKKSEDETGSLGKADYAGHPVEYNALR